jgi:hypothetical protein
MKDLGQRTERQSLARRQAAPDGDLDLVGERRHELAHQPALTDAGVP